MTIPHCVFEVRVQIPSFISGFQCVAKDSRREERGSAGDHTDAAQCQFDVSMGSSGS